MGGTNKRREFPQHRLMFRYGAWLRSALIASLYYSSPSPFFSLSLVLSSLGLGVAVSLESRWQTAEGTGGKHGAERTEWKLRGGWRKGSVYGEWD